MTKQTAHPSREELSAYSLGQLPEERAAAIDTHISECEPCCETIVELSSHDTFSGLLREAGQLLTDQMTDCDSWKAKPFTSPDDIPTPLAEHPRYEIVRLIGKGGMGDVYEARHRMMERTVALKIIKHDLMRKQEVVDRFRREVKAAAQLTHPNVVTAYDAEQAEDIHFMVMEFVDGVDLSQMVKDRGALPVAEACDYIRQAGEGLQHAHERRMVHRDIKPHNLMVTQENRIKILDFGLASLTARSTHDEQTSEDTAGNLTIAGAIMGTPDFISPEQAKDAHQADIRSDIYSLGTTLYFLLSGRPPFVEGSIMHKLRSHAQVEPEPLDSLREDIPPDLVAIVSKMIAKDPADRFQTPAEAVAALDSFVRAKQGDITDKSPSHQIQPRRQRSHILKLIAATTLFAAATAAFGIFRHPADEPFTTGGGGSVGGNGWRFTYGARYLQKDEPGVLFGVNQDSAGNREFSYVVLFRHSASDSSSVSYPTNAGGTFDGGAVSITDGITIDGRGFQLALEMSLNKDKSAIDSSSLSINGEPMEYSRGRLLLVDLKSDPVTISQCNASFPKDLPSLEVLADDTEAVKELARRLTLLDGVRQFLASVPTGEGS